MLTSIIKLGIIKYNKTNKKEIKMKSNKYTVLAVFGVVVAIAFFIRGGVVKDVKSEKDAIAIETLKMECARGHNKDIWRNSCGILGLEYMKSDDKAILKEGIDLLEKSCRAEKNSNFSVCERVGSMLMSGYGGKVKIDHKRGYELYVLGGGDIRESIIKEPKGNEKWKQQKKQKK